jgi:hypothetical protein
MGKRKRIWAHKKLFATYVRGTAPRAYVHLLQTDIRSIPKPLLHLLAKKHKRLHPKVSISTKSLKHIYDDHVEHAEAIVRQIPVAIGSPDAVYLNKANRTGAYIFAVSTKGRTLCAVIDIAAVRNVHRMQVRTAFYASKPRSYLGGLECVWRNVSRFVEPGGQHTPPS